MNISLSALVRDVMENNDYTRAEAIEAIKDVKREWAESNFDEDVLENLLLDDLGVELDYLETFAYYM